MRFETKRLALRSVSPGDAPLIQALYANPEVLRYLPPRPPMTLELAEQALKRRMKTESELGYAALLIFMRDTGEFIGSGGVQPVKNTTDVEIAYQFLPATWGKGYATEAATEILEFAFKTAKLEEVVGVAYQAPCT